MSSSQARLLTLTARMHDIEYKAQRIEAKKLQLANDSRRAYEDYLRVLDSNKIQYKALNADGSVTFFDATLSSLENGAPNVVYDGETSNATYLIKDTSENEILVTEEFAAAYGIEDGEVEQVGSLEQYLRDNGANTDPVMKTVTDYSNPQNISPVENKKIKDPSTEHPVIGQDYTIPDGNIRRAEGTWVDPIADNSLNGDITPAEPVDNPAQYGLTGGIKYEPDIQDVPDISYLKANKLAEGSIEVGTLQEGEVESGRYEFYAQGGQTFTTHRESYSFTQEELETKMVDLLHTANPSIDLTDENYKTLTFSLFEHYLSDDYIIKTNPTDKNISFNETTTLGQYLQSIADAFKKEIYDNDGNYIRTDSPVIFDSVNRKLKINAGNYGSATFSASSISYSITNPLADFFNGNREIAPELITLGIGTSMVDFMCSDAIDHQWSTYSLKNINSDFYTVYNDEFRYLEGIPSIDFSFGDYFDYIIQAMPEADASCEVDEHGGIHFYTENGYYFDKTAYVTGEFVSHGSYIKNDTTPISMDLSAIAENIYLAQSIVAGKTPDEYNTGRTNNAVSNIISELISTYGANVGTDISNDTAHSGIRQLALFTNILNQALADYESSEPKEPALLQAALALYKRTDISSSDYVDSETYPYTGMTEKHSYLFNITNNNVSFTPDTGTIVTDDINTVKTSSSHDILLYLFRDMYDKWITNPSSYSTDIFDNMNNNPENAIQNLSDLISGWGFNDDNISSLAYYFTEHYHSAPDGKTWDNFVDDMLGKNYNSAKEYLHYLDSYSDADVTQYGDGVAFDPNTTVEAEHYVDTDTAENIADVFAWHLSGKESGNQTDFNSYKTQMLTYTDIQLASLSTFYGGSQWDTLIAAIKNGDDISSYLNVFSGYSDCEPRTSNTVEASYGTSGSTDHHVDMDMIDDIATKLTGDIYKKFKELNPDNHKLNAETLKSKIMSAFTKREFASLSTFFNTTDWQNNIVAKLLSCIDTDGNININNSNKGSIANEYLNIADFTKYADGDFEERTDHSITGSIQASDVTGTENNQGILNIPTIDGIASNLVVAFRKAGKTDINETDVPTTLNSKLTGQYGTDTDTINETLANINAAVCDYLINGGSNSTINNIYDYLYGTGTLSVPRTWEKEEYKINGTNMGRCSVTYGTKQVDTGESTWRHDDLYNELVQKWNFLKAFEGNKFKIIHDRDLANSYEYVRNLIDAGAYLLKFDLSKADEAETNIINVLKDTNVSVETSLQEVQDEKELKKAEAKYEADMRAIDRKDRKYDTELAAVDTERNAIKQEMDTLKTVAKDNVDRTFKLFG